MTDTGMRCEICNEPTRNFISTYMVAKGSPRLIPVCPKHQETLNRAMDAKIGELTKKSKE